MSLRPGTYAEALAKKAEAKARAMKRNIKRRQLVRAKPIKAMRDTIESDLDGLWSQIVKLRDRSLFGVLCRICHQREGNTAYHIVPKQRGKWARYALENGALSCSPCNNGERLNRSLYQDVKHPQIFGESFIADLKIKARQKIKRSIADLVAMREEFQKELEKWR